MREEWFTQKEWLGIRFADLGVPLDPSRPADAQFYAAFYQALSARYRTFDNLPSAWRDAKSETARALAGMMCPEGRVLSCGSGIGYVEWLLLRHHGVKEIALWDWSDGASRFAPEAALPFVRTPEQLLWERHSGSMDYAILVQVLYGMSSSEAVTFLDRLRGVLRPSGKLIVVNTSPDGAENGLLNDTDGAHASSRIAFGGRVGSAATLLRSWLAGWRPHASHQGWGWSRDNEAVECILREAGYATVTFRPYAGQSFGVAAPS